VLSSIPEDAKRGFNAKVAKYLPPAAAEELCKHLTLVSYAAGSTLIKQRSLANVVFWIISGTAKIYCMIPNGSRILLRLAGPGDLIGYPTLASAEGGEMQPFEVQALTKCTIAMFSRDKLMASFEKLDQPTLRDVLERLNEPWFLTAHRLATFLGHTFRERLELTFRELASSFGVEDERGLLLNLKLSHMDLAEMIGSSRPMATVLIGEMVAERALHRQGRHQYMVPRSGPIFPHPPLSRPANGRSKPMHTRLVS
jgi:CRP/FNR family cyclic AMP-dependent transcriptional regulator